MCCVYIFILGLDMSALEYDHPFDSELCILLNTFLKRQMSPVCLIAHNGHSFDFPLLKAELIAIGESLPEDVLCGDSLAAFRDLEENTSMTCVAEQSSSHPPKGTNRMSYALGNVYRRVMGVALDNAHNAEADCLALVQLCHKKSQIIIKWFDNHNTKFDDVAPMYVKG